MEQLAQQLATAQEQGAGWLVDLAQTEAALAERDEALAQAAADKVMINRFAVPALCVLSQSHHARHIQSDPPSTNTPNRFLNKTGVPQAADQGAARGGRGGARGAGGGQAGAGRQDGEASAPTFVLQCISPLSNPQPTSNNLKQPTPQAALQQELAALQSRLEATRAERLAAVDAAVKAEMARADRAVREYQQQNASAFDAENRKRREVEEARDKVGGGGDGLCRPLAN
jgi:hypothetical protein